MPTTFENNLRALIERDFDGNVSQAARALEINRTQLNRYLLDNAWPKERGLTQICKTFQTDARVLLQPLSELPQ